jgi:hypothetical protein
VIHHYYLCHLPVPPPVRHRLLAPASVLQGQRPESRCTQITQLCTAAVNLVGDKSLRQIGGSVRTHRDRAPITLSKQERESLRLPADSGALLSLGRDDQAAHRFIILYVNAALLMACDIP